MSKYIINKPSNRLLEVNTDLVIDVDKFILDNSTTKLVTLKSGSRKRLRVIKFTALSKLPITYPNLLSLHSTLEIVDFNYSTYKYKNYMTNEEANIFLKTILKAISKSSTIREKTALTIIRKANKLKNEYS